MRRGERDGRVIVITGTGDAFCAGFDFTDPAFTPGMSFDEVERAARAFQRRTRATRELSVPIVARVNGLTSGDFEEAVAAFEDDRIPDFS